MVPIVNAVGICGYIIPQELLMYTREYWLECARYAKAAEELAYYLNKANQTE